MFFASLKCTNTSWIQGCIKFPSLPTLTNTETQEEWWSTYVRLVTSFNALSECTNALRIVLTAEGNIDRFLFICAPTSKAFELRRYLASFTLLDKIIQDSTILPLSIDDHQEYLGSFPRQRLRVSIPGFSSSGVWFACDYRVHPFLNNILAEAKTLGYRFGYQITIQPIAPNPEWLRDARKNTLRIENLPGVPRIVLDRQQRLVDKLHEASCAYEEFVGVETLEAATWLKSALKQRFVRLFGPMKFETPELDFIDQGFKDTLMHARHSLALTDLPLDEICSCAINEETRGSLLVWRPEFDKLTRLQTIYQADTCSKTSSLRVPDSVFDFQKEATDFRLAKCSKGTENKLDTLVKPYQGNQDYIFMTYDHEDTDGILPIVQQVIKGGYNIWWDKGIPGGAEWDALIEKKIENCQLLLLFVSQASSKSKYCRREVKFADVLGKPMLSIIIEDADLTHGLNMLLTQYQMINIQSKDFYSELEHSIKYLTQKKSHEIV